MVGCLDTARSGCFPVSLSPLVAGGLTHPGPDLDIGCPPPPGPVCDEVASPSWSPVSIPASLELAASEVVLRSIIPPVPDPVPESIRAEWTWTRVFWIGETYNETTNSWAETFRVESPEALANAVGGVVRYGVNDLDVGKAHRFRVGYCHDNAIASGCTCDSDPSMEYFAEAFHGLAPAPPGQGASPPVVQEAEDTFRRPGTTSSYEGGDGLGRGWTWSYPLLEANPLRIHESESYGVADQGGVADYGKPRQISVGPRSYAEMKFALEADENLDGTVDNTHLPGYNFDVRARVLETSGGRGYWGKLARCKRTSCDEPKIEIGTILGTIHEPLASRLFENVDCPADPPDVNPNQSEKCPCRPPLETYISYAMPGEIPPTHIDSVARREPVYLSLEVNDDSSALAPVITLVVAWEDDDDKCPSNGVISDCPFYCDISFTDSSPNGIGVMYAAPGGWGFDSHEGIYRLLQFRAGSQPETAGSQ